MTPDELSHAICMGIRKGLFGSSAEDYSSIDSASDRIAEALEEIANAIRSTRTSSKNKDNA